MIETERDTSRRFVPGFIRNRIVRWEQHQRKIGMAMATGARILDDQREDYFNATELSDRIFESTSGKLNGYIRYVWEGYYQKRASKIAEERDQQDLTTQTNST